MAGSLNNHVDRRAVLQLAATLFAAPLLGVEEPMERLAYALIGPTALQEDTVTFLGNWSGTWNRYDVIRWWRASRAGFR
jgi:hypothetical protein